MAAASPDFRARVLHGLTRGAGATAMARRLAGSPRWVYHVRHRDGQRGARTRWKLGGSRRARVADLAPQRRAWITQDAEGTLAEGSPRWAEPGVVSTPTAVWPQLATWHRTLNKTAARQRASARRRAGGTSRGDSQPVRAGGDDAGMPRGHRRQHEDDPHARPRGWAARTLAPPRRHRRLASRRAYGAAGPGRPEGRRGVPPVWDPRPRPAAAGG
jgi:hypothetical protein